MSKLITALIFSITAIAAQANTLALRAVMNQYDSISFLLSQCPGGTHAGCTLAQGDLIIRACNHARIAVSLAVETRDAKVFNQAKIYEKKLCG